MRSLFAVLLVLAGCASHEVVAPVDISGVPMSLKTDYTITGFDGLTDIAVDGNYLYTIDGSGLSIYDVTMPTSPVLLSASFADVVPSCVAISGTMALIPSNDAGMVIADITDKENPEIIGMDYDPVGAAKVVVSGTNAYVVGNQFHSYDISDPSAPVRLDTVNITGTGKDLAVSGTNAYIVTASASGEAASFVVVNIADPENLSVTSTLALPSTGQGLDISGDYAYVGGGSAGLHVLDISSTPEIVATLATSGALYGVDASGDYAYAAGYDAGFLLVDIENPLSPAEITTVDFAGLASDVIVSGDYAYVESSSAIYIIGLAEITPHTITATAGAHGSITPSGSVSVDYGEDQAFTIAAHDGWRIVAVTVDGTPVGVVDSYTFEDVTEDHTITATFGKQVIYEAESALSKTVTAESALTRTVTANSALCRTVSAKSALTRSLYFESALCRTVSAKSGFVGSR